MNLYTLLIVLYVCLTDLVMLACFDLRTTYAKWSSTFKSGVISYFVSSYTLMVAVGVVLSVCCYGLYDYMRLFSVMCVSSCSCLSFVYFWFSCFSHRVFLAGEDFQPVAEIRNIL